MCNECYGTYPNCPVCSDSFSDLYPCEELEPCTCTDGWIYFDENGNDLTKEQYDLMSEDQRLKDNCNTCNPARLVNGKWEVK